jgi:cytochrome c
MGRSDPPAMATVVALTTDIHAALPAGLQGRQCKLSDQVEIDRAGRPVAHYFVHTCAPAAPTESDERASR